MNSGEDRINQIDLDDFEIIKELNRGGFGIVFLVQEKATKKLYAAKVNLVDLDDIDDYVKCVLREIKILAKASFPTVVGFRGYSLTDFRGIPNITILLDFLKRGSLVDVLKNEKENKSFNATKRHIIITGIAHGMMTLHSLNIIHRDLKPGNVLIDDDFFPHITDFGLSKYFDPSDPHQQSTWGGTPLYEAPEIWLKDDYDTSVDVYAFGLLMYEVVTGRKPYSELPDSITIVQFRKKIVNEQYRPPIPSSCQEEMKEIIESCWAPNTNDRPTFKDVFNALNLKNDNKYLMKGADAKEVKKYVDFINKNGTQADEEEMDALRQEILRMQRKSKKLQLDNKRFRDSKQKTDHKSIKKSFSATQSGGKNDRGVLYKLKSRETENDPYDHLFVSVLSSRDPYNVLVPNWNGYYSSSDYGHFFFEISLRESIKLTGFLIQSDEKGCPKSYSIFVDDNKLMTIEEDEAMQEKHYTFVKLKKPVTCEQFKFVQEGPNWDDKMFIRIKRIELYTKDYPLKAKPSLQNKGLFANMRYLYRANFDPHTLPALISTDTFSCEDVENINTSKVVGTDHALHEFCEFKFLKGLVKVDSYRLKRTQNKDKLKGWDVIGTTPEDEEIVISSINETDIDDHKILDIYPSNDKNTMFKSIKITNTTKNWNGDIKNVLKFHHFDFFGDYYS